MTNDSMPGQVKIGYTTQAVEARKRQLDTTGVPTAFCVLKSWASKDARRDEAAVHKMFSHRRTRPNREWFSISDAERETLIDEIDQYMRRVNGERYEVVVSANRLLTSLGGAAASMSWNVVRAIVKYSFRLILGKSCLSKKRRKRSGLAWVGISDKSLYTTITGAAVFLLLIVLGN